MRVELDNAAIRDLLTSESGPVVRHVTSLVRRVENRSKQLVGVDTGRLRGSISHVVNVEGKKIVGRVGSSVQYARWHHDGTGIHGPKGQPIRPKNGRFLVFTPKGASQPVFARQVEGAPGTHYLVRALEEIVPYPLQKRS